MVASYPGTKTWTGADVLTAADMNNYVRDFGIWLAEDRPRIRRNPYGVSQGISDTTVELVTMIGNTFAIGTWGSDVTFVDVPVDGLYLIDAGVSWEGNVTGYRHLRININGSYTRIESARALSSASARLYQNIHIVEELAAGDEVAVAVYHNAGSEISVNSGAGPAHFSVTYLCEAV